MSANDGIQYVLRFVVKVFYFLDAVDQTLRYAHL